jgi:hypothetical protein
MKSKMGILVIGLMITSLILASTPIKVKAAESRPDLIIANQPIPVTFYPLLDLHKATITMGNIGSSVAYQPFYLLVQLEVSWFDPESGLAGQSVTTLYDWQVLFNIPAHSERTLDFFFHWDNPDPETHSARIRAFVDSHYDVTEVLETNNRGYSNPFYQ